MRFKESPGWHDLIDGVKLDILYKVSDAITDDAKAYAPKLTGDMAASIYPTVIDPNSAVIEADSPARWVEEGHFVAYRNKEGQLVRTNRFVEPQPFLRPALYKDRTDEL